jgi:hypothetical protein
MASDLATTTNRVNSITLYRIFIAALHCSPGKLYIYNMNYCKNHNLVLKNACLFVLAAFLFTFAQEQPLNQLVSSSSISATTITNMQDTANTNNTANSADTAKSTDDTFENKASDTTVQVDSATGNSLQYLENVDILGNNSIGSIYILWDNFDFLDEDVKKSIEEKNFAMDEFFMQNIDRESFEQERILFMFEDRKRQYQSIFGVNLETLIEDEED